MMFDQATINSFEKYETPFYYYDLNLLRKTVNACALAAGSYNFHVHYALKANFNPRVLQVIQQAGLGADCVSGNEVKAAISAGFGKNKVVFAGVGKSDKEINLALDEDIFCFNVESVQELTIINELAAIKQKTARVAIRINPNVDAYTHHNITTGLEENKFGINIWELEKVVSTLKACKNLHFTGIHFHVGSQITNLEVFRNLSLKVNELSDWFAGHGLDIKILNVGGGLGVDYYRPDINPICDFAAYFKVFADNLQVKQGQEVHFELGRALVAQCAALISRVLYVKNGQKKNFLILDAGMTELIRPMLYQAHHEIENLSKQTVDTDSEKLMHKEPEALDAGLTTVYDVVGPICESTDCFRKDVKLPESARGDLIAIRTAGAYGEVMISGYNLRDRAQSVYNE